MFKDGTINNTPCLAVNFKATIYFKRPPMSAETFETNSSLPPSFHCVCIWPQ